jgi:hypothetical protein
MKGTTETELEHEPMGIVISRGPREEEAPTVFAYIWGPAPESTDDPVELTTAA